MSSDDSSAVLDQKCVNTVRLLAADTVEKAVSGHPGAPMGLAPTAHVLWGRVMNYNPSDSKWWSRDRFVLSNGHACALQYSMLHLVGYNVSMDDLKSFRQLGSKTPGHPEVGVTDGIEVTTGPLGQGIGQAVGLAVAETHLAARYNREGYPVFQNYTYCIVGDGCLQEGISSEASSLAGLLGLGRLIVLYDDNSVSIDGNTDLSFNEDVLKRYEAYGWHTLHVADGNSDIDGIEAAIKKAQAVTDRPSIIKVTTVIGYGSVKQGTQAVHGAPLGSTDLANVKKQFGFSDSVQFFVDTDVYEYYRKAAQRGREAQASWSAMYQEYAKKYPELAQELQRMDRYELPSDFSLPTYTEKDAPLATRQTSQRTLTPLYNQLPELVGGSADLTPSNLSLPQGAQDFKPTDHTGRYFRFGIREHAMAAMCNGMVAYGLLRPYCATFFNFIEYALPAVRLSALSHHPVIYVMTHDSIGLGEDGPTHQPVEALALCRAIPNMHTWRPADGNETSASYQAAVSTHTTPSVLVLTRQGIPQLPGSSIESALKGGYVVHPETSDLKCILLATGSEVSLCVDVAKAIGSGVRVVSMPCTEVFEQQSEQYRHSVLPQGVPVVSVEAGSTFGWSRYVHHSYGVDTFGASAPAKLLYEKFGLTVPALTKKVHAMLEYYQSHEVPSLHRPTF